MNQIHIEITVTIKLKNAILCLWKEFHFKPCITFTNILSKILSTGIINKKVIFAQVLTVEQICTDVGFVL